MTGESIIDNLQNLIMLKRFDTLYKFFITFFFIFFLNLAYAKIDIKERSYCVHNAVKDANYKNLVEQICQEMVGNELIVRTGLGLEVNLGIIIDLIKINKGEKVNLIATPDYSLGDDYAPNSTDIFFYIEYNDDYLLIHDTNKYDDEVFYYCKSKDNCYQTSTILY